MARRFDLSTRAHGGDDEPTREGLKDRLTKAPDRVVPGEWAGGIPEEMATLPQLRLGRRWFSFREILAFVVVVGLVVGVAGIFVTRYLRTLPSVQSFIATYPGTGNFGPDVTTGFP